MTGGDDGVRRAYRLGAEAVARVADRAWLNPRPLAERTDPTSHLDRTGNRSRCRLGRVAVRQMVVLPQLRTGLEHASAVGRDSSKCDLKGARTS